MLVWPQPRRAHRAWERQIGYRRVDDDGGRFLERCGLVLGFQIAFWSRFTRPLLEEIVLNFCNTKPPAAAARAAVGMTGLDVVACLDRNSSTALSLQITFNPQGWWVFWGGLQPQIMCALYSEEGNNGVKLTRSSSSDMLFTRDNNNGKIGLEMWGLRIVPFSRRFSFLSFKMNANFKSLFLSLLFLRIHVKRTKVLWNCLFQPSQLNKRSSELKHIVLWTNVRLKK